MKCFAPVSGWVHSSCLHFYLILNSSPYHVPRVTWSGNDFDAQWLPFGLLNNEESEQIDLPLNVWRVLPATTGKQFRTEWIWGNFSLSIRTPNESSNLTYLGENESSKREKDATIYFRNHLSPALHPSPSMDHSISCVQWRAHYNWCTQTRY